MAEPVGRVEISFVDPIKNYYAQGGFVISNIWVNYVCFFLRNVTFEFRDTSTITNVFVFINVNKWRKKKIADFKSIDQASIVHFIYPVLDIQPFNLQVLLISWTNALSIIEFALIWILQNTFLFKWNE